MRSLSVRGKSMDKIIFEVHSLNINHPDSWLSRGKPAFAPRLTAELVVTAMLAMISRHYKMMRRRMGYDSDSYRPGML